MSYPYSEANELNGFALGDHVRRKSGEIASIGVIFALLPAKPSAFRAHDLARVKWPNRRLSAMHSRASSSTIRLSSLVKVAPAITPTDQPR